MQEQKQVFDKKGPALVELDRLLEKSMVKIRKRNQDFIARMNGSKKMEEHSVPSSKYEQ